MSLRGELRALNPIKGLRHKYDHPKDSSFDPLLRESDVLRAIDRALATITADWLETGPWQEATGLREYGDPYRRVMAVIGEEIDREGLHGGQRR